MNIRTQIPNGISLLRVILVLPIGYFLAQPDQLSEWYCLAAFVVAGITDGLDGYLARRLNVVSRLGIALDPIADKIFVGAVAILLILYRAFPIWLAGVIVFRDLAIMVLGLWLMRGRTISLPSNLTGKYTFGSLISLLVSYILRFEIGIIFFTWSSLILASASTIIYARIFIAYRKGEQPRTFSDRRAYKLIRRYGSTAIAVTYIVLLVMERLAGN